MKNVDTQWIVRQMIGSDAKDFAKADDHEPGDEMFRAEEICLPRATGGLAVDHVSLSLRAGEILGIYGLMGAGRSELFDCIMGRHGHATGRIFIDGKEVRERDTTRRIAPRACADPGGPPARRAGSHPVGREQPDARQPGALHAGSSTCAAAPRASAVGDDDPRAVDQGGGPGAARSSSLSGGNQQKVVIGKALLTKPKVLLMDEPSRGIDVGAKADVFRTMRRLSREGLGILFATSDLDEVMALSDRIAVMSNGKLTGLFDRAEATEAAIVAASALGHGPTGTQQARERNA